MFFLLLLKMFSYSHYCFVFTDRYLRKLSKVNMWIYITWSIGATIWYIRYISPDGCRKARTALVLKHFSNVNNAIKLKTSMFQLWLIDILDLFELHQQDVIMRPHKINICAMICATSKIIVINGFWKYIPPKPRSWFLKIMHHFEHFRQSWCCQTVYSFIPHFISIILFIYSHFYVRRIIVSCRICEWPSLVCRGWSYILTCANQFITYHIWEMEHHKRKWEGNISISDMRISN